VEQRRDLGGVVEEILRYSLTDSESQIDVVLRFRNQKLSWYQLNLFEDSPIYAQPQPFTILDAAKNLLERFNHFESASYLEEMRSMLASVEEIENTEIVARAENGVDFSPKSLSLVFEKGVLKQMIDGWFLFTIATTEVNVASEGEAIEIARNAVEDFTWTADGVVVSDFKVVEEPVSAFFIQPLEKKV
jgi:hypothetical protein